MIVMKWNMCLELHDRGPSWWGDVLRRVGGLVGNRDYL